MVQRYEPIRGMIHCVLDGSVVLYSDYAALEQKVKELETEYANDVGRLTSDLRYIQGIVERGIRKSVDKSLPIVGQILEYVKGLEVSLGSAERQADMNGRHYNEALKMVSDLEAENAMIWKIIEPAEDVISLLYRDDINHCYRIDDAQIALYNIDIKKSMKLKEEK